jgi:hypothetical protein
MGEQDNSSPAERAVVSPLSPKELRRNRRVKISKPVRVRPWDPKYREEVPTTLNTSRDGLYFTTSAEHYYVGMRVRVTFPYAALDPCNCEYSGEVVRIDRLEDGRLGIAVRILLR